MFKSLVSSDCMKFLAIGIGFILLGINIILRRKRYHEKRLELLRMMGYEESSLQCSDTQLKVYHGLSILWGLLFIFFGALMIASSLYKK